MRRMSVAIRASAIMLVAFVGGAVAQSSRQTTLEAELRNALRERWDALARGDAVSYGAFLDDDFLAPDNGLVYDKKALVERAKGLKESSSEPREVSVHGDGHAAVMVYRTTSRDQVAGAEFTEELRVVETYIKRKGRWLLTARAEIEIPNANRVPAEINPEVLNDYVGEYEIRPGKIVKVTRQGNRLFEQGPDDPTPEEDLPLSSSSFFQRQQPGILTFTRASDGKVNFYVLWLYDSTIAGKKIK
jgi:Domain of unknown function (DUF4440)/Domain of unknown function (DUF3471)